MAKIIAARFDTQPQADRALEALSSAGFAGQDVTSFYMNPPGQHSQYPIGGDAHHDAGTKQSGKTAAAGATVGGITGLALGTVAAAAAEPGFAAVAGVAAAGVGAYVGSLAGGLSGTEANQNTATAAHDPLERKSGIVVAVRADDAGAADRIVQALRGQSPRSIERAEGEWRDGQWIDFDPSGKADQIEGQ